MARSVTAIFFLAFFASLTLCFFERGYFALWLYGACGVASVIFDERRSWDQKPLWMSSRSIVRLIPMFLLWPLCVLIRLKADWDAFHDRERYTVGLGPGEEKFGSFEEATRKAVAIAQTGGEPARLWDRATKTEYSVDADGTMTDVSPRLWDKDMRELLPDEVRRSLGL